LSLRLLAWLVLAAGAAVSCSSASTDEVRDGGDGSSDVAAADAPSDHGSSADQAARDRAEEPGADRADVAMHLGDAGADGSTRDALADRSMRDAARADAPSDTGAVCMPDSGGGPPPICSVGGWCWSAPTPQGNDLGGVWSTSASDVWSVGDLGTILHWDGATWSSYLGVTDQPLSHVRGSGASDVWAVGAAGTILHWDGAAWSTSASGTTTELTDVWATATDDAWAVGASGTILHYDGTS